MEAERKAGRKGGNLCGVCACMCVSVESVSTYQIFTPKIPVCKKGGRRGRDERMCVRVCVSMNACVRKKERVSKTDSMCGCMYVNVCVCVRVCICMCVCARPCFRLNLKTNGARARVCVCVCVFVCLCACVFV